MKNLLIYINPKKDFIEETRKNNVLLWSNESGTLIKIQIDNSLALGWRREDILLVTNFTYEYNGVKAIEVGDDNFCEISPTASKIYVFIDLFRRGLIEDDLYWFHDNDAFQLEAIDNIDLAGADVAMTDYGITRVNQACNRRWSTGSVFFNNKSLDVFEWIKKAVEKYQANEEISLLALTRHNKYNILSRIKKIDITYNFATRKRNVLATYEIADKPIKIIHFHPFDRRAVDLGNDNIGVCLYGKNSLNKVLVTPLLIDIFKQHGIV